MHTEMRPAIAGVIDDFHHALYRHFLGVSWLGVETLKTPMDLMAYQEILTERGPDLIIETGSYKGGSALFLACMCDIFDHGRVVSVDVAPAAELPLHPRITWLTGDSVSGDVIADIALERAGVDTAMVVLDSNHRRGHVLRELRAYADMVSVGQYLIVEDTNINGHPVYADFGPGPWEAVGRFLSEQKGAFVIDPSREKWLVSFNPGGYLQRVA